MKKIISFILVCVFIFSLNNVSIAKSKKNFSKNENIVLKENDDKKTGKNTDSYGDRKYLETGNTGDMTLEEGATEPNIVYTKEDLIKIKKKEAGAKKYGKPEYKHASYSLHKPAIGSRINLSLYRQEEPYWCGPSTVQEVSDYILGNSYHKVNMLVGWVQLLTEQILKSDISILNNRESTFKFNEVGSDSLKLSLDKNISLPKIQDDIIESFISLESYDDINKELRLIRFNTPKKEPTPLTKSTVDLIIYDLKTNKKKFTKTLPFYEYIDYIKFYKNKFIVIYSSEDRGQKLKYYSINKNGNEKSFDIGNMNSIRNISDSDDKISVTYSYKKNDKEEIQKIDIIDKNTDKLNNYVEESFYFNNPSATTITGNFIPNGTIFNNKLYYQKVLKENSNLFDESTNKSVLSFELNLNSKESKIIPEITEQCNSFLKYKNVIFYDLYKMKPGDDSGFIVYKNGKKEKIPYIQKGNNFWKFENLGENNLIIQSVSNIYDFDFSKKICNTFSIRPIQKNQKENSKINLYKNGYCIVNKKDNSNNKKTEIYNLKIYQMK